MVSAEDVQGGLRCSAAARHSPPARPARSQTPPSLSTAGGAFPEIHVAQYPLDMGRPDKGGGGGGAVGGGQTLALTVNAEGDVNYDAVLSQSKNAQKWLQTTHKALVPKPDELAAGVRLLLLWCWGAWLYGRPVACWGRLRPLFAVPVYLPCPVLCLSYALSSTTALCVCHACSLIHPLLCLSHAINKSEPAEA